MAKAAREGAMPSLCGLPNEIVIWEILVRLPPKALLGCRTGCRAWRSVTSTCDFLLVHHARQPALPLLDRGDYIDLINDSMDICCFDNRPGLAAAGLAGQLQSVALLNLADGFAFSHLVSSCDGLLIFCIDDVDFFICNPATHQYAPLPLPRDHIWTLLGMYPYTPTGEYRLLLHSYKRNPDNELAPQFACHVLSLGSGLPLRRIGSPDVIMPEFDPHVLFRGNLHWFPSHDDRESKMIVVFDTTSESFQEMRVPVVADCADLFEIDNKIGMAILDFPTTIDIWMLQDYEREVWGFNCRIELPVAEIRGQCDKNDSRLHLNVVAVPGDGELLVLVKFAEWLLQVGIDGKLVATFHCKEFNLTHFQLKQTLVPHTFFLTLEGYVVNAPPFT